MTRFNDARPEPDDSSAAVGSDNGQTRTPAPCHLVYRTPPNLTVGGLETLGSAVDGFVRGIWAELSTQESAAIREDRAPHHGPDAVARAITAHLENLREAEEGSEDNRGTEQQGQTYSKVSQACVILGSAGVGTFEFFDGSTWQTLLFWMFWALLAAGVGLTGLGKHGAAG